ncbi:RNA polymerase sigma factor [Streptomyces sp. NPDC060188]|uniref:RNA polymerase sigma factor n=1 Tax=Streptomyces sp. NPDC060188 TaxID=3347068 RepID=UPI0036678DB2
MRYDGSDRTDSFPDRRTVEAARDGDAEAVERLTAGVLPLVYNVVGRAAEADLDVDDIVQDTMVAVIRALPDLRDTAKFRSWLVAITVRQLTDARRRARSDRMTTLEHADERHAPEPDFAALFLLRQSLSAEQRQVAAATAWLDPSHRDLLSLWWLEACGRLSRKDIAAAMNLSAAHLGVQVQRMKNQLEMARTVVPALSRTPRCTELTNLAGPGDPAPSTLLRKRIARHLRSCEPCGQPTGRLVPPNGYSRACPCSYRGARGIVERPGGPDRSGTVSPGPGATPTRPQRSGTPLPGRRAAGTAGGRRAVRRPPMVSSSNSPPRRRARPSPPGWPRSSRQSSSWSRRGRTTPPASGVRPPRHVRRRRRRLPPRRTGPSPLPPSPRPSLARLRPRGLPLPPTS